jgi:DMSO reductase family type II enzyme chaperone
VETCAGTESGSGAWDRVDLYRVFAFVFGAPSADRFAWLQRPELPVWLAELWENLGGDGAFPGVTAFADYQDYESTYIALFEVGLPAPPVPLQESAHNDSIPAPQTVLENISFYEVLGLRVDSARYAPDHLVPQLEFLSAVRYACEITPDAENRARLAQLERDFLERHLLSWVSAAQKKLAREDPPLFPAFMTLLLAFVQTRVRPCLYSAAVVSRS